MYLYEDLKWKTHIFSESNFCTYNETVNKTRLKALSRRNDSSKMKIKFLFHLNHSSNRPPIHTPFAIVFKTTTKKIIQWMVLKIFDMEKNCFGSIASWMEFSHWFGGGDIENEVPPWLTALFYTLIIMCKISNDHNDTLLLFFYLTLW